MSSVKFDEKSSRWILWKESGIRVVVEDPPNFPAEWGGHFMVEHGFQAATPYGNYLLFAKMSVVAAVVQKGLEILGLAPHANIQSNANWAFRRPDSSFRKVEEGKKRRKLHLHIYGRRPQDPNWAEPIHPAYHQEQMAGKYSGKIFTYEQMRRLSAFLAREIPTALKESF